MMHLFGKIHLRKYTIPLIAMLMGFSIMLSACNGQVTIGKLTFGIQRTPQPVVVVKNDAPAYRSTGSENWSGYAITRTEQHDVASVSSSWQIPQVTGNSNADSSTWIGVGGIYSQSLIQAGTDQQLVDGQPVYYAWYELLPEKPTLLNQLSILPGDIVTVNITHIKDLQWKIAFNDQTSGQNTDLRVAYPSCFCSAEWIEELPSIRNNDTTLANFASVTFNQIAATVQGQSSSIRMMAKPIKMVTKDGQLLAMPQVLQGNSFSIVYVADQ